ncbi:MAG: hypothetical protein QM777_04215 [Pseudorhodoferax sp.]
MTIEHQAFPGSALPARGGALQGGSSGQLEECALSYRGVDIRIAVQRTPDYVFGRADLVDGQQYLGRLSIGNPSATPEEVQQRLASLAKARVDISKVFSVAKGAAAT